MSKSIIITTRKSPLALYQAHWVQQKLLALYPEFNFEILPQVTAGDRLSQQPNDKWTGKDLFVKDLQYQLLEKKADIAVHSCKDMSVFEPEGLMIAAFCEREDPRDALISLQFNSLNELPFNARIGTSSPRRQSQIKAWRGNLEVVALRGNVETRLTRLREGKFAAIILAASGLKRLNLATVIREYLPTDQFIPAIGQGVIVVECRSEEKNLSAMIARLDDSPTRICVTAERAVNQCLNGNCNTPLGAYAVIQNNQLYLQSMVGSLDGQQQYRAEITGPIEQAVELGNEVAAILLSKGANKIIK